MGKTRTTKKKAVNGRLFQTGRMIGSPSFTIPARVVGETQVSAMPSLASGTSGVKVAFFRATFGEKIGMDEARAELVISHKRFKASVILSEEEEEALVSALLPSGNPVGDVILEIDAERQFDLGGKAVRHEGRDMLRVAGFRISARSGESQNKVSSEDYTSDVAVDPEAEGLDFGRD